MLFRHPDNWEEWTNNINEEKPKKIFKTIVKQTTCNPFLHLTLLDKQKTYVVQFKIDKCVVLRSQMEGFKTFKPIKIPA